MNINLPDLNGFETLKQLQDKTQTKDIPVIAITAAALPNDIEKGLKAGFKEYITKPINVQNFLKIIDTVLSTIKV